MTDPERITKLQSYGLTENQAKAYMALLELGRATASALNKVSGVPRNKVYSVVEELNEKGLVDIVLEDPIVFEPRPIGRYLDMLVAELDSRKGELSDTKGRLESEFQIRRILAEDDLQTGSFRIFKGRRAVLQQHSRMDRETKSHIRLLASPSTAARMLASGALNEISDTEDGHVVDFEMFTPLTRDNLSAVETVTERMGDTVRVTYGTPENVVIKITDDRSVMFTHFIPDSDSVTSGDDIGVWTDNPVFLKLAQELFQNASARSMSFESAKAMLDENARPPRFDIIQDPKELRKVSLQLISQSHVCDVAVRLDDIKLGMDLITQREQDHIRQNMDRVRILTDATAEEIQELPWTGAVDIRHVDRLPSRFAIFDRRVLRAYAVDPEDVSPISHLGNLTLATNLESALEEARDHFDRLWESGTTIELPEEVLAKNRERVQAARPGSAESEIVRPRHQ